ncbi:MAG: tRNA pseudouridine(38-40) synthase TruA [Prevotellaceae bacterium]|jgi:tRNA pseudouridine38-40 synthase|nr:tRNA pseudouridine(38-40) synthase TruA [Prevotellaceae bacterium]
MTRTRIDISFKGTAYHGWQIQKNAVTVQEKLNKALSVLLCENIETTGCGRTDTGVHARRFTAHFDCVGAIDDFDYLKFKLNMILPRDVAVIAVSRANPEFHSRFDAVKRTYKYFIHTSKNPFKNEYSTFVPYKLDLEQMNRAAAMLKGNKDFTSFSKLHTDVTDNFCNVGEAEWIQTDDSCIFTISANRFLRNMVRAIVGTMIDLGRGKISDFAGIIDAADRNKAGSSAPSQGLFLWDIQYVE